MLMKSRVLIIGAASVLALTACTKKDSTAATPPAATASADAKETVVATVNGTPIYSGVVEMMVKERTAQGQPDSPELRKMIIENMAMQSLVAAEASKKGLDKSAEVTRQLDMLRQSLLANAYVQDYIKNNPVTDAMLKAEYDKINSKAGGNEYKARHILVKEEAEAKAIIAKLKKDMKSFGAIAKDKSQDPGSKVNGGDLGWFNPAGMVPEFGAAVQAQKKGEISETPIKSQFGYHVIVVDDSRPITPPPFDQVKEQLKQQVQRQNLKTFLDELKAKAKIDIVADKTAVAAPAAAPVAPVAPAAPVAEKK